MLSFASQPGNFFNLLGKLGLLMKQLRSYQISQQSNMTDPVNGVVAQLVNESDVQAIMGDNWIPILSATDAAIGPTITQLAAAYANRLVFRDNPQFGQTLTNAVTLTSLQEIIRQMKIAGATVLAMNVTGTPGTFADTESVGTGVVNVSTIRPLDGKVLENLFAENFKLTCSSDSYTGNATANNEPFSITGAGAETDFYAFDWPLGSGAQGSCNAIDGSTSNGSGNLLNNSGFDTFTVSNIPDGWIYNKGTAGVNFFKETSLTYTGAGALRILGDGATLYSWQQNFDSSSGSQSTLNPLYPYGGCVFLRRDGSASLHGTLQVALVDQNGNIIKDQNGAPNSISIDLTKLTPFYTGYVWAFRTPLVMPTSQGLRFALTQYYDNGRSFYMDMVSFGQQTQFYLNGPFVSVHAGNVPFELNDYAQVTMTNSRGAGGVLDTFQTLFFRVFPDAQNNELLLPSSSTPTISDTLIG